MNFAIVRIFCCVLLCTFVTANVDEKLEDDFKILRPDDDENVQSDGNARIFAFPGKFS